MIIKYVIAVVIFCVIILFHELGHFWLAKANGIRVNEFCLGFGPTLFGFTKGETKYSLKLIPFGGACMMEGEDAESDDSRAFHKKSVWARISVVAAGPLFNFLIAFIIALIILGSLGFNTPVISEVEPGYAAEEAGLCAGDEIVRLNGTSIHFFKEITLYRLFHSGESVTVTYKRDGERHSALLAPTWDEEQGGYIYGIYSSGEYVRAGPFMTMRLSLCEVKYWIKYTLGSLKMLITREVSVNELSGPVGIVKAIGDTYDQTQALGTFYVFINMMNLSLLITANLGVINLLPLPALDGGRLVFLVIEAIRGRRVNPDREGMVHFLGLMCLFALMILVMLNDVRKIIV